MKQLLLTFFILTIPLSLIFAECLEDHDHKQTNYSYSSYLSFDHHLLEAPIVPFLPGIENAYTHGRRHKLYKKFYKALYRLLLSGAGRVVVYPNRYRWGRVVERRAEFYTDRYERRRGYRNTVDHIIDEWEYGNPGQRHIQRCKICGPRYCELTDYCNYDDTCLCS